ncbi:MAG: ATP-binding protein [Alphaproteobacteria bacterium]
MQELVVISGKGGTGKTSITAAFASLAQNLVIADCDVDAANLHIILNPKTKKDVPFLCGKEAAINQQKCSGCNTCYNNCKFNAIKKDAQNKLYIDPLLCEGCGLCVILCPEKAIDFNPKLCGKILVSDTELGDMIYAEMETGAENSGKLVSQVRTFAKNIAQEKHLDTIVVDGPPGTSCPAIASITGADKVLIVTEPTVSGLHDAIRVLELTNHFKIPSFICVNKWDINEEITTNIEEEAQKKGAIIAGRISYNKNFNLSQKKRQTIMEICPKAAEEITLIWEKLYNLKITK